MTYTENYRLRKPAGEDFIDIEDLNQNMEQLDGVLAGKASIQIGGTEPTGPGLVLWFAERKVKPQKVPPLRLSADAEGEKPTTPSRRSPPTSPSTRKFPTP